MTPGAASLMAPPGNAPVPSTLRASLLPVPFGMLPLWTLPLQAPFLQALAQRSPLDFQSQPASLLPSLVSSLTTALYFLSSFLPPGSLPLSFSPSTVLVTL